MAELEGLLAELETVNAEVAQSRERLAGLQGVTLEELTHWDELWPTLNFPARELDSHLGLAVEHDRFRDSTRFRFDLPVMLNDVALVTVVFWVIEDGRVEACERPPVSVDVLIADDRVQPVSEVLFLADSGSIECRETAGTLRTEPGFAIYTPDLLRLAASNAAEGRINGIEFRISPQALRGLRAFAARLRP